MRASESSVPTVTFQNDQSREHKVNHVFVKTVEIARKSTEDKAPRDLNLSDFEIKGKGFAKHHICPLFQRYNSKNFMIARFDSKCPKQVTTQILSKGIDVCYENRARTLERYTFFAHSASQLRSRVCVLYNNNPDHGTAENIISEFGDFKKIKTAAKRAARIGLLLSTAGETVKLQENDICRIGDVERNEYTFTDGCGYISPPLAEKITQFLSLSNKYKHQKYPYPSVFQVRMLGCKGVLSLKPSLQTGVEIRKSMEKFRWLLPEPYPLGIVDKGYSRPYEVGSLNKQFILLLSALGIKDEVFLKKQKTYFKEIMSLTRDKDIAFTYLCAFGEIEIAEQLLESKSLDDTMYPNVLAKLKTIQQKAYESPSNSASEVERTRKSPALRLKIPIEKSRNVYGVCDPSENDLKYGTCFFQPTIRGEAKPIVGRIVVAKNPCYSPGDVRVLDCVDAPSCQHLVDCIVFPTDGERPHPDEIAGSDLDGDKFFVCWDPDLVPYQSQDPVSYPAAKVPQQKDIQQKDLIEYFARYSNSTIGKIDFLFARWADRKGVASMECKELSALFSRAVDSAKTGERVVVPQHLQIKRDDEETHGNFVWHKMASEATLFIESKAKCPEVHNDVQLTEETLRSILGNDQISVSDYQLFRFLCKWAVHEGIPGPQMSIIAKECIDFTTFSLPQLRRARIDCSDLTRNILLNPFIRSKILSEFDCKYLIPESYDRHNRYSLVFRASAEDLSWDIFKNVLTSALLKILVFKFLIGNLEWVCVLNVPQQLQSGETLEVNKDDHSLPQAYLFIHQDDPISESFAMDSTYSFSLYDQRLQIYQGTKTRTFISVNMNDANELSVSSIDLQRFNPRLSRKLGGVRVRKEAFVDMEVYCLDPDGEPISKIHFAEHPAASTLPELDIAEESQFHIIKEDFPDLGEEYAGVYLEAQKEMRRLRNLHTVGSLKSEDFSQIQNLLERMDDSMDRHEWACQLEALLDDCRISYGDAEHYQCLLVYLLEGLKKCGSRVLSGGHVNVTLHHRLRRVLDRMRNNLVSLSVKNILELFQILLFVHDYQTSRFVVCLLSEDVFPISRDEFSNHDNSYPYFIHWSSLLYLEILEEIKEQENLEIKSSTRHSRVCEGTVSKEADDDHSEGGCVIFVYEGEINWSMGDYLALSPINAKSAFRERKYILEVKLCRGKHLYADAVWPNQENVLDELSRSSWKIAPFPNLVSFKRMLDALTELCTKTSLGNAPIFAELLNTWSETKKDNDETSVRQGQQDSNQSFEEASSSKLSEPETVGEFSPIFPGNAEEDPSEQSDRKSTSLNPSQERAVRQACGNPLTLIQGPPGTGKSKTSANIIKEFLAQSTAGKILAVAETNEGVDNLLEKIVEVSKDLPASQVLRIGSSTWTGHVRESLRKFTLEARYAERSGGKFVKEKWMNKRIVHKILSEAMIVCTTCSSAGSKILESTVKFSKVLVDEASQATEPAILVPICRGSEVLVLVGDDKQLPPTIKSKNAKDLGNTTFSRLRATGHPVYLLDTQYRMHPSISEFPSKIFYDGKLKNGVNARDRPTPKGFPWPNKAKPVVFVTTPKDAKEQGGRSKKNVTEAEIVKLIVDDILRAGDLKEEEIGIVTPYTAQVNLLKENLKPISVRSVDGFQGQERELIIFSAVRSNDVSQLGFLDDDQRMNVLLTRARRGLVVVGNRQTLAQNDSTWKRWIEWMGQEKLIIDSETLFPSPTRGAEKTSGNWRNRRTPDSRSGRGTRGQGTHRRETRGTGARTRGARARGTRGRATRGKETHE